MVMKSINIIHLVSGEQVIAKVTELRDKEGEPFCFLLSMPMALNLVPSEEEKKKLVCSLGVLSVAPGSFGLVSKRSLV